MSQPFMTLGQHLSSQRPDSDREWLASGALTRALTALPFAAAACSWIAFYYGHGILPLDDAYIHFAYAKNLADTGLFCLNAGEPSLGTSSAPWVVLLALLRRAHVDLYWGAQALSLGFFVLLLATTMRLVRDATERLGADPTSARVAATFAGLLLALNGNVQWMVQSGMETTMLLAFGFLAIAEYGKRGFGVAAGALAGLVFAIRAPGAALIATLVLVDIARGRRPWWRGLAAALLVSSPALALNLSITHGLLPTSATGKLLTYVDGSFDPVDMARFTGSYVAFQKYVPQNFALTICALGALAYAIRRSNGPVLEGLLRHPECSVAALWGVLHFAAYDASFRALGSQGRYLVEEQIILTFLGSVGALYLALRVRRSAAAALGCLCLVGAAASLPYWRRVYFDNGRHIEEAYVRMGEWIAANTPRDARIAAFDIGILRYIGDRYTIDLGGLVDPGAHPCLRKHDCGPYVRDQGATYVLYSKDPDADLFTGVLKSESDRRTLLKQTPVAEFGYRDFQSPTVIHSIRLDLERIDGWFPRSDPAAMRAAFAYDGTPYRRLDARVDDALTLVGYARDVEEVRYIRPCVYTFGITLLYSARRSFGDPYWAHFALFDPDDDRVIWSKSEIVTEDALRPGDWPIESIVQDHRAFRVPYDIPGRHWRVRVALDRQQVFDERYPELHEWHDLGQLDAVISDTHLP
jgi:hypothetical protein